MKWMLRIWLATTLTVCSVTTAIAECPDNPAALNTGRTITVRAADFPMVGKLQYLETLRLRHREVVLTFDDGPVFPYTSTVLDILARECVKATFFVLGQNVAEAPDLVRRMVEEGHSVGTHTFSHPDLSKMPLESAKNEIDKGIEVATEALQGSGVLTPFFRAPMLATSRQLERFILSRGLQIWSIDVDSKDWTGSTEEELVKDTIAKLEAVGRGIVLLHDIQPVTARALPALLTELKKRKFKIVHVRPAAPLAKTTGRTGAQAR